MGLKIRSLLLLGLLGFAAFHQVAWAQEDDAAEPAAAEGVEDDEYADADRAHLVVRKFIKDAIPYTGEAGPVNGLVVQGRNVTIVVDIYNAGSAAANEVTLKDTLHENATLVDGSVTAEIGKITSGSHVKHTYTVVFTAGNTFASLPPATVSYVAEADSASTQESFSTVYGAFVMTPVQQIKRYALRIGTYVSLGFARSAEDWRNLAILVGVIGIALGANWATKRVKAAGVNRRREKALKELEKSD